MNHDDLAIEFKNHGNSQITNSFFNYGTSKPCIQAQLIIQNAWFADYFGVGLCKNMGPISSGVYYIYLGLLRIS